MSITIKTTETDNKVDDLFRFAMKQIATANSEETLRAIMWDASVIRNFSLMCWMKLRRAAIKRLRAIHAREAENFCEFLNETIL